MPAKVRTETTRKAPQKRSPDKYNLKRQEVIDVAARVFAERGYHATTIDDLVEATGLQRGGLYHYIEGKRELLIQIHERFIDPLLEETRAIAAADDPPEVALRRLAHALMKHIDQYHDQVTVFLHEWRSIEHDASWKNVRAGRREFEQAVSDILERGEKEGVFTFGDRRLTVLGLLGMINYSYQWFRADGRMTAAQVADYFTDTMLHGIASPAAHGPKKQQAKT